MKANQIREQADAINAVHSRGDYIDQTTRDLYVISVLFEIAAQLAEIREAIETQRSG